MGYNKRDTARTLGKKDDYGLNESLKIIRHYQQDPHSPLFLDPQLVEERKKSCGFCGRPLHLEQTKKHFGEDFHESCTEAMKRGQR